LAHHDFGVYEILRAAETYKADFQGGVSEEGMRNLRITDAGVVLGR
jgi:hypothetical protein